MRCSSDTCFLSLTVKPWSFSPTAGKLLISVTVEASLLIKEGHGALGAGLRSRPRADGRNTGRAFLPVAKDDRHMMEFGYHSSKGERSCYPQEDGTRLLSPQWHATSSVVRRCWFGASGYHNRRAELSAVLESAQTHAVALAPEVTESSSVSRLQQ